MKKLIKLSLLSLALNTVWACEGDGDYEFTYGFCENFTVEEFKKALTEEHLKTIFAGEELERIQNELKTKGLEADLDGLGLTQLMCAAYNEDLTMAEELIKAGANVNSTNICGKSVLMLAAKVNKNPEMIKLLLKNGAKINDVSGKESCPGTEYAFSALAWAIDNNENPKVAMALIEAGADVNTPENDTFELPLSQINNNAYWTIEDKRKIAKAILNAGAKAEKAYYNDLFGIADKELAELLVKQGANVKEVENLDEAVRAENLEMMNFLLNAGVDVSKSNALINAKKIELVNWLIKNGVDVNRQNSYYEETALMNLIKSDEVENRVELVKAILDANPNLNLQNKDGWTATMLAVINIENRNKEELFEISKLLLAKEQNVDLQNNNGWTVLSTALRNEANYSQAQVEEIVKLILDKKPKLYLDNKEKWTALHYAVRYQNPKIVKSLIEAGADLEQKTIDGYTPLMLAIYNSNYSNEIIDILLEAGADPKVKNNDAKTAVDLAKDEGKLNLAFKLLKKQMK